MKLLLDEHYANDIAVRLRAAGHDVVTVAERGLRGMDDESLLALAASEGRAVLTNNARDFLMLIARRAAAGEEHSGVVLTSDASMPRGKNTIGAYVSALRKLMDSEESLANQVRWLG